MRSVHYDSSLPGLLLRRVLLLLCFVMGLAFATPEAKASRFSKAVDSVASAGKKVVNNIATVGKKIATNVVDAGKKVVDQGKAVLKKAGQELTTFVESEALKTFLGTLLGVIGGGGTAGGSDTGGGGGGDGDGGDVGLASVGADGEGVARAMSLIAPSGNKFTGPVSVSITSKAGQIDLRDEGSVLQMGTFRAVGSSVQGNTTVDIKSDVGNATITRGGQAAISSLLMDKASLGSADVTIDSKVQSLAVDRASAAIGAVKLSNTKAGAVRVTARTDAGSVKLGPGTSVRMTTAEF